MNGSESRLQKFERLLERLNHGLRLWSSEQFEEALVVYRQALDLALSFDWPEDLNRALEPLQMVLFRLGLDREAEEVERRVNERKEELHPRTPEQRRLYELSVPPSKLVLEKARQMAIRNKYDRELIWDFLEDCKEQGSVVTAIDGILAWIST